MKAILKISLCFILALLCSLSALTLIGCNSDGEPEATTESTTASTTESITTAPPTEDVTPPAVSYEKKTYSLADIEDKINILGRSPVTAEGLRADWSASGFEFVADCKGLIKIKVKSSHSCRFNIYIDGGNKKALNIVPGTKDYTLTNNLEAGEHKIRFVKSSMVEYATEALAVDILSLDIYGEIKQANAREHFIEFIGDSITCGVGAFSKTSTEAYSELSYAYLAANKLDADYSLVSISGIGAGRSTNRHNGLLMGQVYSLTNYYRSKTEKYAPERKADLVVINLNTNDKGTFAASQKDEFVAKVKDLIDQVKSIHGEDAKIVWVMGMMSDPASGFVDAWTINYLRSLGGENAGYYYFLAEKNNDGGSTHPIADAHARVADELAKFINDKGILG